jgi:hypothetical protein
MREVSTICVSFQWAWIHAFHFCKWLAHFHTLEVEIPKHSKTRLTSEIDKRSGLRYTLFFLGGIDHIQRCKGALQMYKTSPHAFWILKEGVCTKILHLLSTHQKKVHVQNLSTCFPHTQRRFIVQSLSTCFPHTKRRFMYKVSPLAFQTLKEGASTKFLHLLSIC